MPDPAPEGKACGSSPSQPSAHLISNLLVCKGKNALAQGQFSEDGFVVFAGSTSNRTETGSINERITTIPQQLMNDGALEVADNDTLRFTTNHILGSQTARR